MIEEWRQVLGFPYEVSSLGRVQRMETGKLLVPWRCPKRDGVYLKVDLCRYGIRHAITVHRLVATAFIPHDALRNEVNHIDCDTMNNRLDNLEWCTRQENEAHKRFWEATA